MTKLESILSSNLNGAICVERAGLMPDGKNKEATQDWYITELQKENERHRTILEGINEKLGELAKEQKDILSTLARMASDERAGRVRTDMRLEKVENGLSAVHVRMDDHESRIATVEKAPGQRTQTVLGWAAKATMSAVIGGVIVLLTLGFRAWIGG